MSAIIESGFHTIQPKGSITSLELKSARLLLLKMEQIKWPASVSAHINLGLFSDNQGLLRCRGRFHHSSSMESTAKFPYYLSEKSQLAKLLVLEYHMKLHHVGPSVVIAEMRRQYWIPCLRQLVRHTIYFNKATKCLPCFIMQLKPFNPPPEPPLPSSRVDIGRLFKIRA